MPEDELGYFEWVELPDNNPFPPGSSAWHKANLGLGQNTVGQVESVDLLDNGLFIKGWFYGDNTKLSGFYIQGMLTGQNVPWEAIMIEEEFLQKKHKRAARALQAAEPGLKYTAALRRVKHEAAELDRWRKDHPDDIRSDEEIRRG